MSQKEAYQQKLQARLDEWQAKVDVLKAKAAQAEAETKLELYEQIETLRLKQDTAKDKLLALTQAGENAWEELKIGMEKAWVDLGDAVEAAHSKFK